MSSLLRKNGHGEPHGARICIETALILERLAAKKGLPLYSGLVDGLRKLAEEIEWTAGELSPGAREIHRATVGELIGAGDG